MRNRKVAIGLTSIASLGTFALNATPAMAAASWVQHPLGGASCPIHPGPLTYFKFNGGVGAPGFHCHENGPHAWTDGHQWYVQRMWKLGPVPCHPGTGMCYLDLTRACSHEAINQPTSPADGPTGGGGCAVYQPSVRNHPIPTHVSHVTIHRPQPPVAQPKPKD
jgi:hypothetical protein